MSNRRLTTWFLLGYFAMLVNLGPSMHHADFFGCHVHAGADEYLGHVTCCCQHRGCSGGSGGHAREIPQPDLGATVDLDGNCHGCLLCQFFKHFNAYQCPPEFEGFDSRFVIFSQVNDRFVRAATVARVARGPPQV